MRLIALIIIRYGVSLAIVLIRTNPSDLLSNSAHKAVQLLLLPSPTNNSHYVFTISRVYPKENISACSKYNPTEEPATEGDKQMPRLNL